MEKGCMLVYVHLTFCILPFVFFLSSALCEAFLQKLFEFGCKHRIWNIFSLLVPSSITVDCLILHRARILVQTPAEATLFTLSKPQRSNLLSLTFKGKCSKL